MNSIYEELDELIMKGDKVKLKKAIKSLKNINMKDKDGQTLLDYAIFRGNRKLVKALLNNGAYMDVNNPKLTEYAAFRGDEKLLKTLIKYGANINAMKDEETPLINAINRRNIDMFKMLVKNGANIEYSNVNGKTLLMYAVQNGDYQLVNEIVKLVFVDKVDENMETALMHAVRKGNKEMVNALLENGASFSRENLEGETPLIIAVKNKDSDIINLLISKGASMEEENRYGKTAMMIEKEGKNIAQSEYDSKNTLNTETEGSRLGISEENYDSKSISSVKTEETIIVDERGGIALKSKIKEKNPLKYQNDGKTNLNKTNNHLKNSNDGIAVK